MEEWIDGLKDDWMVGETESQLEISHKTEGVWLWVFTY
jgi:hypothetical protein